MSGEVAGKVCVVTGGSRGIGAAICALFADHGGKVINLDRDPPAIEAGIPFHRLDVTSEQEVVAVAQMIARDHGGVDILVNNAGIARIGPSMSFLLKDWEASFAVMTTGVFLCSREFGKIMRGRGGGGIVNISSINGFSNVPMRLAYNAAKAAVISMTKVLAIEWAGYAIRVNAVAPGMIETEMLRKAVDDGHMDVDAYMDHLPMRRFGQPRDVAEAVLFLASDRSSYVTGQVIVPDGGWTAFNWIPWSGDPEAPQVKNEKSAIANPDPSARPPHTTYGRAKTEV
ncbi:3-oxoacyl-ACP reductase [Mesorhizobium amorphae]|uniref:SDR family NAD(P)-dependent oxidoreductase n=1 Tax=Mesorhizobium amorphae TaxID=71433 RepID=UPI00235CF93C|nr:SDR family NAD(P)-dependent oxidoreductase [Mesorhizobium amorphae]GLR45302.1 3-oxoacyl-ACP reductase [Mesorhizobium amorphae]